MAHDPLSPAGSFCQEKRHFAAIRRHFRTLLASSMAELFVPYRNLKGRQAMPYVVMENQCGKVKRSTAISEDYQRIAQQVAWTIVKKDLASAGLPRRKVKWALRKWLVPRDTTTGDDVGDRAKHKRSAEDAVAILFSRYLHTEGARELFREARRRSRNRHDMCDALLLGIYWLLVKYAKHAQRVLGRRRPHEVRPDTPVLTAEQMNGGTLRGLFIDSGTVNMGVCLLELVGVIAPPADRLAVTAGLDSPADCRDPEPVFRILALELVDLKQDWDAERGQAAVTYWQPAALAPVMSPNYDALPAAVDPLTPVGVKRKRAPSTGGGARKLKKIKIEEDRLDTH